MDNINSSYHVRDSFAVKMGKHKLFCLLIYMT